MQNKNDKKGMKSKFNFKGMIKFSFSFLWHFLFLIFILHFPPSFLFFPPCPFHLSFHLFLFFLFHLSLFIFFHFSPIFSLCPFSFTLPPHSLFIFVPFYYPLSYYVLDVNSLIFNNNNNNNNNLYLLCFSPLFFVYVKCLIFTSFL